MDERKKKSVLVVINNFVHDVTTGLWLACFFLAFYINRRWPGGTTELTNPASMQFFEGPGGGGVLSEIQEFLFITSLVCLFVIGITGVIRRMTYTSYLYGVDLEVKRRNLLIFKHILLAFIAGGGTYFLYQWSR